ncbi:MAG TPA: radical SAM protein [Bacteroidia bacterium]|nr:radical SAM protein [Bacteroidia bacterium]
MKTLLVTPPFTQLNTPYPATAYLKGFLNTLGYETHQCDLSIEVILRIFSKAGLADVFDRAANWGEELSENAARVLALRPAYLRTIGPVMAYLQNRNSTLAHQIVSRQYLPEAGRFADLEDLEFAFGTMGTQDHARHLATLYLEDLGDLITEAVDPEFGFSRYAERLGRTATHFREIEERLQAGNSLVSEVMVALLGEKMTQLQPDLVCLTVPFPGNLFGALKCGQYIRQRYPHCKIALGGGYANTELRSLGEPKLFDYVDFVALDDGEAPIQFLLEYLEGKRDRQHLKRIFLCEDGQVRFINGATEKDVPQRETGTPDYADLPLGDYLSVVEMVNPMHRLWSDGRWNKLTLAHGCYWGKCSFCDVSLDYIRRYEPMTAALLCDRIEEMIEQTGQHGFHFVDEAAPPALMRDLAIEIIRRGITVTWWTNIRFEKSFTLDLCRLLHASGCIAVSGGLEVAGDRLLEKMKKGVTVAQVANVTAAFTEAGIMVHAYLMYGFPTQTAQETIDSLEMVRQMLEQGIVQSGFWHQFAMTAHSPVGLNPAAFGVLEVGPKFGGFADNDRFHDDPEGADHELFAEGLRKSLFNYMRGTGFDVPLRKWFDHKVPRTRMAPDYIAQCLEADPEPPRPNAFLVWLGNVPRMQAAQDGMAELEFVDLKEEYILEFSLPMAAWLHELLPRLLPGEPPVLFTDVKAGFVEADFEDYEDWDAFWESEIAEKLRESGLLVI